jgi:pSer/pThr/pTyr-binding forkhead associated (FHA) protein
MVHSSAERVAERLSDARSPQRRTALLQMGGRRLVVGESGATLGRSRQSDVMVDDPNVSRAHAEVRPHGDSWVLADLGSTNGTRLNGRRVTQSEVLKVGDEIELGTTTLTFALE